MSAHSPVGPGERTLVSYLRRNRNEKTNCHSRSDYCQFRLVNRCIAAKHSGQGMPVQTQYTQLLHQTLTSELQKSAINAVKDSTRDCWQRLPAKMHHIDKD